MGPLVANELRLWGMLGWSMGRFDAAWRKSMAPVWRVRNPVRPVPWLAAVAMAGINLLSFALLAWASTHGQIALAALAVYTQALGGANGFRFAESENANLALAASAAPALARLEQRLPAAEPTQLVEGAPIAGLSDALHFERVTYCYPGRAEPALDGLDLTIPAGRSLAIVGANGAGKTTMVKLLCRLYDPTAGRISVDDRDLTTLDARSWRRGVAAIFQDFAQYHLSARENVTLGAPKFAHDRQRLEAAAEKAGALEIIAALPHGWDTVLSRQYAGGTDLSGGQWQRIALARALFAVEAGARLLILDEPTANLDVRAEAALYDRFLDIAAGLTTILISHRFSTVRRADHIVVIEQGKVVETGTHADLVIQGGQYAAMFALQASRFVAGSTAGEREAGT